jgi:hypothetical protein
MGFFFLAISIPAQSCNLDIGGHFFPTTTMFQPCPAGLKISATWVLANGRGEAIQTSKTALCSLRRKDRLDNQ